MLRPRRLHQSSKASISKKTGWRLLKFAKVKFHTESIVRKHIFCLKWKFVEQSKLKQSYGCWTTQLPGCWKAYQSSSFLKGLLAKLKAVVNCTTDSTNAFNATLMVSEEACCFNRKKTKMHTVQSERRRTLRLMDFKLCLTDIFETPNGSMRNSYKYWTMENKKSTGFYTEQAHIAIKLSSSKSSESLP